MALTTPNFPPPIRTESNAFAHDTMSVRVPGILRDVLTIDQVHRPLVQRELEHLVNALQNNEPIPMLALGTAPAPDHDAWAAAYADQQAAEGSLRWLTGSWFFAETFVYRHLIQIIRWHETRRDPFLHHKRKEIADSAFAERVGAALEARGTVSGAAPVMMRLPDLLLNALWGNRSDLSHPAGKLAGGEVAPDDLLVDERALALDALARSEGAQGEKVIHVIADNAGTELAMDLVLIEALLAAEFSVTLHVKAYPIFVSDTTIPDVWHMLDVFAGKDRAGRELADSLRKAWQERRFILGEHPFWTGSHFWWKMPASLRATLEQARLIIVKGDLNYRRIVGDAIWPDGATLATALAGFRAPVLTLRTLKSDGLIGVTSERQARLDAIDPAWRVTGRYGVIQYAAPREDTP